MNKYKNTILVVDDELKIVEIIKAYLEKEGYNVCAAYNGEDAIELHDSMKPALILLDLMLPGISGSEVCVQLRRKSQTPIIMLTARTTEEDIVDGLNIGADDYITKPFSPRQLIARVKALLRRTEEEQLKLEQATSYNNGELTIDPLDHEVKKNGRLVSLTPVEFNILLTMSRGSSKIFTREELIYVALGGKFEGYDRTIDSHIKNLRQKIEDDPKNPIYIVTIRGIGYKFGEVQMRNIQ